MLNSKQSELAHAARPTRTGDASVLATHRDIRALAVLIMLLALASTDSVACTCNGIGSIESAISDASLVVLGRVKGPAALNALSGVEMPIAHPLVVEVVKTLKGQSSEQIYVSNDIMCYRSFDVDDLKPGDAYVFALFPVDISSQSDTMLKLDDRLFLLRSCSHTALALSEAGNLYSNEPTSERALRLEHYMSLSHFEFLLSSGVLGSWRLIVYSALAALLFLLGMLIRRRFAP